MNNKVIAVAEGLVNRFVRLAGGYRQVIAVICRRQALDYAATRS